MDCGTNLEQLVASSREQLLLVAPFIKQPVITRLFDAVEKDVSVVVYTRWRPDEVAAGVSDLEVFEVVAGRPGASLWLCNDLHAKYYRSDARVLVGSANLTAAALGWSPRSNLEILVESFFSDELHGAFERVLMSRSVRATVEARAFVERAVALIPQRENIGFDQRYAEESPLETDDQASWLPVMRHPEALYRAYAGRVAELAIAGREQSARDLEALELPLGLTADAFRVFVASILVQVPIVVAVDGYLERPRRFGEMRDFVGRQLATMGVTRDASEAWQTLMRWLLHFLPDRYTSHTARYSEIFAKRLLL